MASSRPPAAIDALRQLLGPAHLLTGDADRAFFSTDIFRSEIATAAVAQPGSVQELSDTVRIATRHGLAVLPRGGGMSYTDGYIPDRAGAITIDTRRLDRIVEINADDMFVTVECGVTWIQLNAALEPKGLRTPFWGTGSGRYATVGGTVSQNAINYGSARFGPASDSVLGLEVVLADGRVLKTGSAATPHYPSPFFRTYGPDLTGLFLADTGALGVKAHITLKLIRRPAATQYGSFEFPDYASICAAMSEIAREGVASEMSGYDASVLRHMIQRRSLAEDLGHLGAVAKREGLGAAARVVLAGRRAFRGVDYSLHFTVDGRDSLEAESGHALAEKICRNASGKAIEPSIPKLTRAGPFPLPNLLFDGAGRQWIPVHAIVPHSRLVPLIERIEQYFSHKADTLKTHGIDWGFFLAPATTQAIRVEPCFFFPDAPNRLRQSFFSLDELARLAPLPSNPAAHAAVRAMRQDIAALSVDFGAAHFQIARMYRYRESREAETFALLRTLKAHVDPDGLMNPGALGL